MDRQTRKSQEPAGEWVSLGREDRERPGERESGLEGRRDRRREGQRMEE